MTDATTPPPPRLAVGALIGTTLGSLFRYPGNFFRRAGAWIAVGAILVVLMGVLPSGGLQAIAGLALFVIVYLVGAVSFTLNWLRGLLVGEPPASLAAVRLDRRFRRFLGTMIVYFVLVGSVFLPGLTVIGFAVAEENLRLLGAGIALGMAGFVGSLAIGGRLSVLPALLATDAPAGAFGAAWRLTRGQTWRLAGALFVVNLVINFALYPVAIIVISAISLAVDAENAAGASLLVMQATYIFCYAAANASLAAYAHAGLTGHKLGHGIPR